MFLISWDKDFFHLNFLILFLKNLLLFNNRLTRQLNLSNQ